MESLEAGIMNRRRFATVTAASCGTVVLAGWIVASLAGFGSAAIENTSAAPIVEPGPLSLAAAPADARQATALGYAAVENGNLAKATESVRATDARAASDAPESIAKAASSTLPQMAQPETPRVQVATANPSDLVPNDAKEAVSSIEIFDECRAGDLCI